MARIDKLEHQEKKRTNVHEPVEASYTVFDIEGVTYLQIDTYGSSDRKIANKVSQSIQLGPEGINALLAIIKRMP